MCCILFVLCLYLRLYAISVTPWINREEGNNVKVVKSTQGNTIIKHYNIIECNFYNEFEQL